MPKWSSEGLSVVAFLVFKPACWILVIYYIKQGLLKQKVLALYAWSNLERPNLLNKTGFVKTESVGTVNYMQSIFQIL